MVCLLVHQGGCAITWKALRFLMHHWEDVPASYGRAEGILLDYVLRHPGERSWTSGGRRAEGRWLVVS